MVLFRFLLDEGGVSRHRLAFSAFTASLGSVLLLLAANLAAEKIVKQGQDHVDWVLGSLFVGAALAYYLAEQDLIHQIGRAMETAIDRVRGRLLEGVRAADFARLERLGSEALYEGITQSAGALSANSQFIALSLRSGVLTGMVLIYILYLSPAAFALVLASTAAAGVLYWRLGEALGQRYGRMMGEEQRLFRAVDDLFAGFREVRLSSARAADLGRDFGDISGRSTAIRIEVQQKSFERLIFGHVAFFFMLAVVVFVLPSYVPQVAHDVVKISAAVIFMIGPLGGVIQAVNVMAAADAAARRMLELDRSLAGMREPGAVAEGPPATRFEEIRLVGAHHAYPAAPGERPFEVGPIDLVLRRGEVVFITGGNGSGKSSFIKLLCGLYRPDRGYLMLDGERVGDDNRRAYRERIAAVFADHHLYRKLHGLEGVSAEEARELLAWMEIDHVASCDGLAFNRVDFSSGQRKRVLLVAALLEHRPILVLDEWAADQDPHFRYKFYREVVPALKARGITVIAVTHDDHYFDVADRRLHFEEGRMRELRVGEGG